MGEQRYNLAIGVNGGVNMNTVDFSPKVKQSSMTGMTGGVTLRYISEKYFKMICGAQVELNFSQRGWKENIEDYPELQYQRKMNYIDVPFLAHLAFGKEKRGMQIFIHLGPQFNFLLSESKEMSGNWQEVLDKGENFTVEQHDLDIKHKFDYGIVGGLGTELKTKAGNFLLEGRYYFALADMFDNTKKGYFGRSANQTISVKLSYLFDIK